MTPVPDRRRGVFGSYVVCDFCPFRTCLLLACLLHGRRLPVRRGTNPPPPPGVGKGGLGAGGGVENFLHFEGIFEFPISF